MTLKAIEDALRNLRYTIDDMRHYTRDEQEIRVRIGRELVAWINGAAMGLIINYDEDTCSKTIYGYPLEIDNEKPMCLEVLLVKKVHVEKR